jgi:hypothetical protein
MHCGVQLPTLWVPAHGHEGIATYLRRARTAGGGAPFSPADIAGLMLWVKADGTLWQDDMRTTPVTSDSDPVGAWDDESGLGSHLLQATGTKRPLYKTGVQNSLPAVRFDLADDFLRTTANPGAQPIHIFAACKGQNTANTAMWDGDSGSRCMLGRDAGQAGQIQLYNGSAWAGGSHTAGTFSLYEALSNGSSSSIYVNASAVATGLNPGTSGLTSGFTLGGIYAGGGGSLVDCGELLIYQGADVSGADLTNLRDYLNDRWAMY